MLLRRLARILATTVKAIIICHAQKAAPTLATVLEIAALAGPLIKTDGSSGGSSASDESLSDSSSAPAAARHHRGHRSRPAGIAPLQLLLSCSLRFARGWAPAVVVAQAVRLVGGLVQKREQHNNDGGKREGTEVRALQLGLSVVPRVDPRVPRSLEEYAGIYKEWLLLLRGRLAQTGLELPDMFDEGLQGDEELMRFALCFNLLQARSLREALVAMDRTISNIREFVVWHSRYRFINPADLEAWQRLAWWEGPDPDGHLWLMIDFRAAVQAARTHGADTVAHVLVSNVEYGVQNLIPELGCAATLRVVCDASGVHIGGAMRSRAVFMRVGHILDRMYPCRLQLLYLVGLPFPMRWTFKAALQLLRQQTRRRIRLCRATEVPRRLPSQLRSHRIMSVGAGLDALAGLETVSLGFEARDGSVVGLGSEIGEPFTPAAHARAAAVGGGPGSRRRMFSRWRRGAAGGTGGAAGHPGRGRRWGSRRRQLAVALGAVVLLAAVLVLLGVYVVLLLRVAPESSRLLLEQTIQQGAGALTDLLIPAASAPTAAAAVSGGGG